MILGIAGIKAFMDITPRNEGGHRMKDYITLTEWAERHGIDPATARQRALRGAFETAEKLGRIWVIRADEELIDHRRKGGE